MSWNTFRRAMQFTAWFEPVCHVLLTGGEPTEHPDFIEFVRFAIDVVGSSKGVVVLSNGMFLDDAVLRAAVLGLGVSMQVTNDARYYPRRIRRIDHPSLTYCDRISRLDRKGRARRNDLTGTGNVPTCYNLRAASWEYGFRDGLRALRSFGKLCQPTVDIDGTVRAGESTECQAIGTVLDDADVLTAGIRKPCWCDCVNALPVPLMRYFNP